MATTLKSIVQFLNVGPGATVSLPHGIRDEGDVPAIPDHVEGDTAGFMITADDTDVTVTNNNPGPASTNVLCELWHTIERPFGAAAVTELSPRPFVVAPGGAAGATLLAVQDEGVLVGVRGTINLIGAGVAAVDNAGMNRVDITIAGTIAVQDEGVLAGARPTINFIGAGVVAVDNPGMNRVDVTIPGAGGPVDLNTAYHNGPNVTADIGNSIWSFAGLGETVFDSGIQLSNPTLATAIENQFTPSWVQWGSGWKTNFPAGPSPIGFAVQGQPIGGVNYSEGELHFLVNPDGGGFYSMGAVDSLGFFRAQQFGGYGFIGAGGQGLLIDAGLSVVTLDGASEVDISILGTPAAKVFAQGLAVLAGAVVAPGLFVDGDVNTGLYQAAVDTLSIAAGGVQATSFTAQGMGIVAGAVGAPSIFVLGDTNTGIYPDGPDQLSIAAGGARAAIFTVTGVGVPVGTAAIPGLFIQGNSDTGIFESSPNVLGIAAGGVESAIFSNQGVGIVPGLVGAPGLFVRGDTDTGLYSPAPNQLSITCGGVQAAKADNAGLSVLLLRMLGDEANAQLIYSPGAPASLNLVHSNGELMLTASASVRATSTTAAISLTASSGIDFTVNAVTSALIRDAGFRAGVDGTLAAPVFARQTDTDTGLYFSAANILDVTVGGVQNARFAASSIRMPSGAAATPSYTFTADAGAGIYLNTVGANKVTTALFGADILIVAGDHVALGLAGSAAVPMLSWEADQDTGLFNQAADAIGITCGGTERARFTTQGMGTGLGAVGTPPLFFLGDTNTGIYSAGADQVDIACGGVQVGHFFSQGLAVPGGAAATPGYSFIGDGDTGIYRIAADQLGIALGGTVRAQFIANQQRNPNGSAALPSYSFTGSTDMGLYRVAADQLGVSTAGTERARVDTNTTASETALLVSVAGAAVQRVSVGANDSGGAGFRVLRVAN